MFQLILFMLCALLSSNLSAQPALPSKISPFSVDLISGEYVECDGSVIVGGPMPVVLERRFDSSNDAGWSFFPKTVLSNNPEEPAAGKLRLKTDYDSQNRPTSIQVINANASQIYGGVTLRYSKNICIIETHQGRRWTLTHDAAGRLENVIPPDHQVTSYQYLQHPITKHPLISQRSEPEGRYLINEYYTLEDVSDPEDPRLGRVKVQKAPAGPDSAPVDVARYDYEEGQTIYTDALNGKTIYHYDDNGITSINYIGSDGQLYRTEQYAYQIHPQLDRPFLISHTLCEGNGAVISRKTYAYDDQGALIKETQHGSLGAYSTTYIYSEDGRHLLLRKVEDNGNSVRYLYTPQNDLITAKLVYEGGHIVMRYGYTYDQDGILISTVVDDGHREDMADVGGITERQEKSIVLSKDEESRGLPLIMEEKTYDIKSQQSLISKTTLYTYSSNGLCIQQQICGSDGACGDAYLMDYDENGRVVFLQNGKGDETHITYDANGNKTRVVSGKLHEEVEYTYDYSNRLIRETKRQSNGKTVSTTYVYDLTGRKIVSRDHSGNETRYSYDALGRLNEIVYPAVLDKDDHVIYPHVKHIYDAADRIVSSTDENGHTTTFQYNERGNPVKIVHSDGTHESYEYNPDGSLKAQTAKTGAKITYTRDFLGRPLKVDVLSVDGQLIRSSTAAYTSFKMTSQTDANGNLVLNESVRSTPPVHKPADRPVSTPTIPNTTTFDDDNYVNERGQIVLQKAQIDALGNITLSTFDALGRVENILFKDGMGTILSERIIRYDALGNKVLQKDIFSSPEGQKTAATAWTYGPENRLESHTEFLNTPHERTTTYIYNEQGLLERVVKPDGVALMYEYNDIGQMLKLTASDGSLAYAYTYDSNGNILEVQDLNLHQNTLRRYNDKNILTMEQLGHGLQMGYDYNEMGQLSKLTLHDGSAVEYIYDATALKQINRLSTDRSIRYSHTYSYDSTGKLAYSHLAGSLGDLSLAWSSAGRCLGIQSPYWSEIIDEDAYDAKGKIHSLVVQDPSGMYEDRFSYDEQGQLLEESGGFSGQYSYDNMYNRLSKNGSSYAINDCHEIVASGEASYEYDANGNLLAKHEGNRSTTYHYDALNRLTHVTKDHHFTVDYTYDAFNRRLTQKMSHWDSMKGLWRSVKERRFLYDGEREIGAADDQGKIVELRVLGLGLGADVGSAVALEINQNTFVPIHDHRGSIRCLVNMKTGLTEEFYRYSAFGEAQIFDAEGKELKSSKVQNPWGYSSKRLEAETGLIDFGRRDYDPELGRWITPDPLGFVDTPNRYAYLGNNPLSRVDLQGLSSFDLSWENIYNTALYYLQAFRDNANLYHTDRENYPFFTELERSLEEFGQLFMGPILFRISGWYVNPSRSGVWGDGEKYEKMRITFINGILNNPCEFEHILSTISEVHGWTNVHYTYRGTQGWTVDMIHCTWTKLGWVSENAIQLAETWKRLIQEMGGTEGGGTIIHYAHSIGGTETMCAKNLMTPEELKMIRVITFGSATVIPNGGFRDVVNYSNRRDGVSNTFVTYLPNPIGHIYFLLFGDYNLIMTGSHWGAPLVDHLFDSYWNYWLNHANEDMPGVLPEAA